MSTPDISKLSAAQLQELIAEAQAQISNKHASELTAHCDLFVKKSKDAGYTLKQVIAELRKFNDQASVVKSNPKSGGAGKPRAAKFRGPNGETWSGAGLQPKWLKALIASGKKKEDFAI
jgi:DNA-binding protein H-NS